MPIIKSAPIDVENLASKLPRPLQWPVGAALGGLKSILGADDPGSSVASIGGPMMAAEGPILKGLGALNPMFTAVGEEVALNAGRPAGSHLADPLESVYQRMMSSGAGNSAGRAGAIGGQGLQEPHPAIRALMDTLGGQPEPMNPLTVFSQEKVGGYQVPHRSMITPPEGFELPAETSPFPARDPSLVDTFTQRRDSGLGRAGDYRPQGGIKPLSQEAAQPGKSKAPVSGFDSKFSGIDTKGYSWK